MNLSTSQIHYIKAIYELSPKGEGIRISDIAVNLDVTKASVCAAMKNLEQKEMVYRDAGRLVFLTDEGEYQAMLTLDKFLIIRGFLTEVLGIKAEIAEQDACAIEHVISTETLCSICCYPNRKCTGGCYIKTD